MTPLHICVYRKQKAAREEKKPLKVYVRAGLAGQEPARKGVSRSWDELSDDEFVSMARKKKESDPSCMTWRDFIKKYKGIFVQVVKRDLMREELGFA